MTSICPSDLEEEALKERTATTGGILALLRKVVMQKLK